MNGLPAAAPPPAGPPPMGLPAEPAVPAAPVDWPVPATAPVPAPAPPVSVSSDPGSGATQAASGIDAARTDRTDAASAGRISASYLRGRGTPYSSSRAISVLRAIPSIFAARV